MKNIVVVDFENGTLNISSADYKKAQKVGTKEYKALVNAMNARPDYELAVGKAVKMVNYELMHDYVVMKSGEEKGKVLQELKKHGFCLARKWFYENYTEVIGKSVADIRLMTYASADIIDEKKLPENVVNMPSKNEESIAVGE